MKIIFQLFASLIISSCPLVVKQDVITIDFQNGFNNHLVEIVYNENLLYKDRVTTDEMEGFAASFNLSVNRSDECTLVVNGDKKYDIKFDVNKPYIGINYLIENDSIQLFFSSEEFLYD